MSWTPAGFQRQRLPDLLTALEADLNEGLGPNLDLGSTSLLGRIAGITALRLAEVLARRGPARQCAAQRR